MADPSDDAIARRIHEAVASVPRPNLRPSMYPERPGEELLRLREARANVNAERVTVLHQIEALWRLAERDPIVREHVSFEANIEILKAREREQHARLVNLRERQIAARQGVLARSATGAAWAAALAAGVASWSTLMIGGSVTPHPQTPWVDSPWPAVLFWCLAVLASSAYGWRALDVFVKKEEQPKLASQIWHQRWFNFAGSLAGWMALWAMRPAAYACLFDRCEPSFDWGYATLAFVAFTGITGHLPWTLALVQQALRRLGELVGLPRNS